MVIATLAFAVVFLPEEVASLRNDAAASAGYVTNWYLIFSNKSYFEAIGRPSLLQHLWSLAVEEQFYLLWPPLLAAGLALFSRKWVLAGALAGAAASAALMAALYTPDADPSRVYYGTDTRAAGLLLGAALAFVWVPSRLRARPGRLKALLLDAAGLGALGGLVYLLWRFGEYDPLLYTGGFALLGLATATTIAVAAHPGSRLVRGALSLPPLTWMGLRSYSIYLWHWPVFMLTRPQLDVPFDGWAVFALRVALTLALAELSYRFVEVPARNGALGRAWKSLTSVRGRPVWRSGLRWAGAGALMAGGLLLGVSVASATPPPRPAYLPVDSVDAVFTAPTNTPSPAAAVAARPPTAPPQRPSLTPAPTDTLALAPTPAPTLDLGSPVPQVEEPPTPDVSPPVQAVAKKEVNVRTGPGKAYPIIDTLRGGERARVTGRLDDGAWLEVRTSAGKAGWVYSEFVRTSAPPESAPVAAAPPLPEPSPAVLAEGGATPTAEPSAVAASALGLVSPTPFEAPLTPPAGASGTPQPQPSPVPVTALGDSVMLGAASALGEALGTVEVDASVSRATPGMLSVLKERKEAGRLGEVVVIHVGTNGPVSDRQFDEMMQLLVGVRRVVFVNLKVPRWWEASTNAVLAAGVSRYANTVLVDWHSAAGGKPYLFAKDGVHPQREGVRLYVSLIAAAVYAP
jgi:peptidoglycan/LPS O-acetylase OafA/YrhL